MGEPLEFMMKPDSGRKFFLCKSCCSRLFKVLPVQSLKLSWSLSPPKAGLTILNGKIFYRSYADMDSDSLLTQVRLDILRSRAGRWERKSTQLTLFSTYLQHQVQIRGVSARGVLDSSRKANRCFCSLSPESFLSSVLSLLQRTVLEITGPTFG